MANVPDGEMDFEQIIILEVPIHPHCADDRQDSESWSLGHPGQGNRGPRVVYKKQTIDIGVNVILDGGRRVFNPVQLVQFHPELGKVGVPGTSAKRATRSTP